MNNYQKCKYRHVISQLNEEYINHGCSNIYLQNLNKLLELSRTDGCGMIFIFKNLKCRKEDMQNLTNMFETNIINLEDVQTITAFATVAKCANLNKLTRLMCEIASSEELCKFATVKGVNVSMIINKLAECESLTALKELSKVVPLRYRKQARDAIIYLKNDGVVEDISYK